jgi:multidrug efflux pump subunit AcrA (membrane-fusion protein)
MPLFLSILLALAIIAGSIYAAREIMDSKDTQRPTVPKQIKVVRVDTVRNQEVSVTVSASGSLVAREKVALYSEVQGIFKKGTRLFKTGQPYRKGETLIRIDPTEYKATVVSARSNLYNQITGIMPDLRLDFPEAFPQWEAYLRKFDLNRPVRPLPKANSELESFFISGRGIDAAYYNLKNLESRLSKFRITAPFDGVLTEALVTEGTLIRPGQKLGEFINPAEYELEVSLSKTYGDLLKVGNQVVLTELDDSSTYKGYINRVNARVDPASQTITVFIGVRDKSLKEGQYLQARLRARKIEDAYSMDRSLLQEGNRVYVVRDTILDLMNVEPVHFGDSQVVLKGLPEGSLVLSRPVVGAHKGMRVKIDTTAINTRP